MNSELENILISTNKNEAASYLKSNPKLFGEALNLALSERQPYSWRAASLLWCCMKYNDARIKKFVKKIISALDHTKDGHQRELLNILFKIDLKGNHESVLFDKCMSIWENINKQPSVRSVALKHIVNIAQKHPELMNDIIFITQDRYLNTLSPAIRKAVGKIRHSLISKNKMREIKFD